jgi:competence protein ComGC
MKTLMKKLIKKVKGFTLLEILLVVGTIAILAGIVIIAINPSKQLAQVRNTERKSDLKQVANAITQFYIDKGYYPASTTLSTTSLITICPTGASSSPAAGFDCDDMLNLSELVPTYIVAIPNDPATTTISGYSVVLVNNNPAVSAPLAELGVTISVGNVPTVAVPVVVDCGDLTPACGDPANLNCWSGEVPDKAWGPNPSITGVSTDENASNGICNTTILHAITPGEDD